MIVGLSCSTLSVLVAILIGLPSGFFGGKYDIVIQRFIDAWMCFPGLFIILVLMTLIGKGMLQVILVIGVLSGVMSSRVVRSAVISIKENVYINASQAIGCSSARILLRHILPNIIAPLIIIFSLQLGNSIMMEATISFLGFGIPPPAPSWGGMLSGSAREYMFQAPWMIIWPGLALAIAIYGINMLGDAVRDILDPKLIGGVGRYGNVKLKGRKRETA
jgi:peptide/nickel transport system permease protein